MSIYTRNPMARVWDVVMLSLTDMGRKGTAMVDAQMQVGRRREYGVYAGLGGVMSLLLISAAALIMFLWQPDTRPRLGQLSDLAVGEVQFHQVALPATRIDTQATATTIWIYLVRPSTSEVLALSQRDPRTGCQVVWQPQEGYFIDPCHGSAYTLRGESARGSSARGLDRFPVQVSRSGEIVISSLVPMSGAAAQR